MANPAFHSLLLESGLSCSVAWTLNLELVSRTTNSPFHPFPCYSHPSSHIHANRAPRDSAVMQHVHHILQLKRLFNWLCANVRAKVPLLDPSTMLLRRCGSLGVDAQKLSSKFTTKKMVTPAPVRLKLSCTTLASSCLRSMKALWSLQLHLLASLMLVQSTLLTLLLTLNTPSSLQRCLHIQEATPSLRAKPSEWGHSMVGNG